MVFNQLVKIREVGFIFIEAAIEVNRKIIETVVPETRSHVPA
jgi:hypothetical protein